MTLSHQKRDSQKSTLLDFALMIGLLLLSVFVVYFSSQTIAKIYFFGLLVFFSFMENDYFWFAFFFILVQGPGYLFADFSGFSEFRLPLYSFLPGFSFTPIDLFVVLAFVKAMVKGRKVKLRHEINFLMIAVYMVSVVIVTAIIFESNIETLAWNLRWIFYYSLVVSFLFLVRNRHEVYRFILLSSIGVFIVVLAQIYLVTTGNEFINLLNPSFRGVELNEVTGGIRPVMGGVLLLFFGYAFAMFLLADRGYAFARKYLYVVVACAFFSVFLSATRLWSVIFSVIFIGYFFITRRKILSTIGVVVVLFLLVGGLVYSGIIPDEMLIDSSWARVSQIFDVAKGDIYSAETAMHRIVYELPVLLNVIKQSPFIGYGVSNISMRYYDGDFGFANTILMFGVIGFFLFIALFANLFASFMSAIKGIRTRNPLRSSLYVLIIIWIGILVGYFTTYDFFTMYFDKIFFIAIVLALSEFFTARARGMEYVGKDFPQKIPTTRELYDTSF